MLKAKIIDQNSENSVMKERLYLSNMRSPFIVNMICSFQDNNNLYLGLELMKGGDLRYHLINHSQTFTETQLKFLAANLVLGLEYIHSKKIIHRDIKPENILFDDKGYAYITDFNISCKNEEINNLYDISGTPAYMAPESIGQKHQDFTVDFYGLGIICYECIMGNRPYEGNSRHDVKKYLNENNVEIEKDERITDLCQSFINGLLNKNPADRLGANSDALELKENLFFKNINWDILKRKKYASPISEIISFAKSRNQLSDELFDPEFCNKIDEIDDNTKNRYSQIMAHENYPIYFRQYTYLSRDAVRDIALKNRIVAAPPKKSLSYSRSSENINLPKIKGTYSSPSYENKSNGGHYSKYNFNTRRRYKNLSGNNSLKDYYEYKLNKYKQLLRQTDNNNGFPNPFNYYQNCIPYPMEMNPMNYQNKRNNMNGNDIYNDVCNGLQRKLYRDIFGGMDDDFDKNKRSSGLPNQYQINNYFPPPFMMPGMGFGMGMMPYPYMMPPYGGKNDFFFPKISSKSKHNNTKTTSNVNSHKSKHSKKSKNGKKSHKSETTDKSKKAKKSKKEESEESESSEEGSAKDSDEESEEKESDEEKGSEEKESEEEKGSEEKESDEEKGSGDEKDDSNKEEEEEDE